VVKGGEGGDLGGLTVPVASTSPGISVCPSDIVLIKCGMEKMRSLVVESCRSSPLTCVWTRNTGSSISFGTAMGPYMILVSKNTILGELHVFRVMYHRTKRIRTLANIELLMIPLPLPRRDIIHNRISPHILHCLLLLHPIPYLPDNHTDLALIVGRLRELRMREDLLSVSDNARVPFGKDDGMRWLVHFIAAVETGAVEFASVF